MTHQITKEEVQNLIKVPGEVRGQVLITDLEYVKEKKDEEGIKLLKRKMEDLGKPIDYEKAKIMEWYPIGLRVVSLLAIKEIFNWNDQEIWNMGNSAPKYSLIVKMLMKYFLSLEKISKEISKYWAKHYSIGNLETAELNPKEKYWILHLKEIKVHPILCTYLAGYFLRIATYVIKNKRITLEETKCMFKGDPYHEFMVRWK